MRPLWTCVNFYRDALAEYIRGALRRHNESLFNSGCLLLGITYRQQKSCAGELVLTVGAA